MKKVLTKRSYRIDLDWNDDVVIYVKKSKQKMLMVKPDFDLHTWNIYLLGEGEDKNNAMLLKNITMEA